MASVAKTVVATGASSGLGFEAIKLLMTQAQPYNFILGARDTARTKAAFGEVKFDTANHSLTILPLELSSLKTVKSFAQQALAALGQKKLDYLFLNAALGGDASKPTGPDGSRWCESLVVNHFSQHYLIHLLREKLTASHSRIVVVSTGAVRNVPDTSKLEEVLTAGSGAAFQAVYSHSKFAQLLGAHWWRRQLGKACTVVAVSPGLVPGTGLGNQAGFKLTMDMPDAVPLSQGASSLLRAFTRDDLPSDPEQIFLTSWGEWWPKDVYGNSLDKALQDKWCPGKEELEKGGTAF